MTFEDDVIVAAGLGTALCDAPIRPDAVARLLGMRTRHCTALKARQVTGERWTLVNCKASLNDERFEHDFVNDWQLAQIVNRHLLTTGNWHS